MDMEAEIRDLQRQMKGVPSRFAGGGAAAAVVAAPWVSLSVMGGNKVLLSPPADVYGIKRKVGEAKPSHWIYIPRRPVVTCTLTAGAVSAITTTDNGVGYTAAPAVSVSPPPSGVTAVLTPTLVVGPGGKVEGVYLTNCGSNYTSATITFAAPGGGGTTATGSAVLRDGKIVAITITNAGSRYTTTPAITIGGTGTAAAATAVMSKGYITFAITTAGSGYVTAPTVTINPPSPLYPYPQPPQLNDTAATVWADGVGWGIGTAPAALAALPALICHDDRGLVAYGLMGEGGGSVPLSRAPDGIVSWYTTMMKLSIADANADGVLPAWVPMGGGV